MKNIQFRNILLLALLLPASIPSWAEVRLPKVLGAGMVLQRELPVPIWGWADPGETVRVTFGKQQRETKADGEGRWRVDLAPMPASANPAELVVAGTNTIRLADVLVGEVWLCSGQSNMEYPMALPGNYAKPGRGEDVAAQELAVAKEPLIRLFKVEKVLSSPDVTTTGWHAAQGEALGKFSAAGYFFAKELHRELQVPIGVIQSAWGGSRIEPWTPAAGYTALPAFAPEAATENLQIDGVQPGKYYQSMVAPLAPFALRGFLWYQGESNAMQHESLRYADKTRALVESWRQAWGREDMPFYFVQIAPYLYTQRKDANPHTVETLPEFWEGQAESLRIPRTDMVVVTDLVDDLKDIHPSYKWEVGRRLALLALAHDYGKKNLVYNGPRYKSMQVSGRTATLTFDQVGGGLKSRDGQPLTWFTVAGADGKFVPAQAEIKGNKVVVSSPEVPKPVAVRFGWHETAQPNLTNKEGLPAAPFRTDSQRWTYK